MRSHGREWWWWGDDRAPPGGEKSSRGGDGQRGPREGGAEGKRQLFNASAGKENEVAAEFSFSRDISLPLPFPSTPPPCPCPIAFSARLSVSNIEFPLYNSLCPIYRPAYVRNVFLVHPSDASVIIAYDFRGTGDESRESEITGC